MNTISVNIRQSAAVREWMRKESGSFEDHNNADSHPYAILARLNGKTILTVDESATLIKSGYYHATGWNDDEINGGAKTKQAIMRIVELLKSNLNNCPVS